MVEPRSSRIDLARLVAGHARPGVLARDPLVDQADVDLVAAPHDRRLLDPVHLADVGAGEHHQVGGVCCVVLRLGGAGSGASASCPRTDWRRVRHRCCLPVAHQSGNIAVGGDTLQTLRVYMERAASATHLGGAASTRRSCPRRRCWPTTPSASPRSRSTTPSTGCRRPSMLRKWAAETPRRFRFALKSPRRITHEKKLADVARRGRAAARGGAGALGDKLGPILFQLPPFCARTCRGCRRSWPTLPPGLRAGARVPPRVLVLRRRLRRAARAGAALCIAEAEDLATPLEATAGGATCGCGARTTTTRRWPAGPSASRPQGWDDRLRLLQARGRGPGPEAGRPACPDLTADALALSALGG